MDGLRRAGYQDHLARGLLTRAWLRSLTGDADGARADLDEAWEIAERGPMPLFQADVQLHRARLFRDRDSLAEARRRIEKHGYGRRLEELVDAEEASVDWPDPPRSRSTGPVSTHEKRFRIALSFPGEHRTFVEQVAGQLARQVGRHRVLYDRYYEAELARPDLDTHLQGLYHDESELIVVFLCAEYERREWCGLEWRAIRDLIKKRRSSAVMPFRFDNTEIPGLFSTDGYVWLGDGRTPKEAADLVLQRLALNEDASTTPTAATNPSPAHVSSSSIPPPSAASAMRGEATAGGQLTVQFKSAVELLSKHGSVTSRVGGIYELERVIQQDPDRYWPVMEVLCAHVREYRPEPANEADGAEALMERERRNDDEIVVVGGKDLAGIAPIPDDIQAALNVLGRRRRIELEDQGQRLDLSHSHLSLARLENANLSHVNLKRTDLRGADLCNAKLLDAKLQGAKFGHNTRLAGADLSDADLSYAIGLTQAQVNSAKGNAHTNLPEGIEQPNRWRNAGPRAERH